MIPTVGVKLLNIISRQHDRSNGVVVGGLDAREICRDKLLARLRFLHVIHGFDSFLCDDVDLRRNIVSIRNSRTYGKNDYRLRSRKSVPALRWIRQ